MITKYFSIWLKQLVSLSHLHLKDGLGNEREQTVEAEAGVHCVEGVSYGVEDGDSTEEDSLLHLQEEIPQIQSLCSQVLRAVQSEHETTTQDAEETIIFRDY